MCLSVAGANAVQPAIGDARRVPTAEGAVTTIAPVPRVPDVVVESREPLVALTIVMGHCRPACRLALVARRDDS